MSSSSHALLAQLGKRIRALRLQKGWTQTDLAVHLELNRGHISDIERGKREAGLSPYKSSQQACTQRWLNC
jgi:transcriptional regulator with XRE-family HTH domain